MNPKRRTLRPAEAAQLNADVVELREAVKRRTDLGLVRCYARRLGDDRFSGAARDWAAEALARLDPPLDDRRRAA